MATKRTPIGIAQRCMGIDCEGSTCVAEQAEKQGVVTYIQRMSRRAIEPCLFGQGGTCCRTCSFGPCMMIEDVPESIGLCGATPATVAARNFCRMVAAGASAHMDHALETAKAFLAVAKGESEYKIKDEKKLRALAEVFEIKTEDRSTKDIAIEVGEKALAEFGKQDGGLYCIKRAPKKRQELWKKLGVMPRGIQREVVEVMHRTHMGTDQDYRNDSPGHQMCFSRWMGWFNDIH